MKKIFKKTLLTFSLIPAFLPTILTSSCKAEDYEKIDDNISNDDNKAEKITYNSQIAKNIYDLYTNDMSNLFANLKTEYFAYKKEWQPLKRNYEILKSLLNGNLKFENQANANFNEYKKFLKNWFPSTDKEYKEAKNLGLALNNYDLIFADVEAVLADTNLAFNSKQFTSNLKIIDDRLNKKDIPLEKLQEGLISVWKFVVAHLFNSRKITKKEDLDKIDLKINKNSHTHSHAIINLTYELSLWHERLLKELNLEGSQLISDLEKLDEYIINNTNNINWQGNRKVIIDKLNLFKSNTIEIKINDIKFQHSGQVILDKLKLLLNSVATKEGLKKINFDDIY